MDDAHALQITNGLGGRSSMTHVHMTTLGELRDLRAEIDRYLNGH